MPAYTLYWEAGSGALAPQAMLEEMGIGYHKVAVDMDSGEHRRAAYLAVHPTGQVPALDLGGGTVIGESAAMVLVLGERHPEAGLVPANGDEDRPVFLRWLFFMAASVYMTFVRFNHPERFTAHGSDIEPVRTAAMRDVNSCFEILDKVIEGRPYFLVRGFSALDIYLGMLTIWHPDRDGLFARNARVGDLVRTIEKRPAFGRVMREHLAGL